MEQRKIQLSLNNPTPVLYPDVDRGTIIFGQGGTEPEQPKLIWLENAIVSGYGIKSLGYSVFSTESLPAVPTFSFTKLLLVSDVSGREGLYYCAGTPNVGHYVFDSGSAVWDTVSTASDTNTSTYPTTTFINGVSYTFKPNFGLFTFDTGFTAITVATVQGITMTSMSGVCAGLDYLIAWDSSTVYWSAPGTPLDFRPTVSSVSTGAGSSVPQALRGLITKCVQIPSGFIIYGTVNAVSARYSGNSLNPWIFEEIPGSSGLSLVNQFVGKGITTPSHFVFADAGLQEVTIDRATNILPEISNFLAACRFVTSDHDGTFTKGVVAFTLPNIVLVAERYLCVSYKTSDAGTSYSHILVWDLLLKGWGLIAMDHYDIFDFQSFASINVSSVLFASPGDLGIWTTSGHLRVVYLSFNDKTGLSIPITAMTGELIWSDFALTSSSTCTVTEVEFAIDAADGISSTLHDLPFIDNTIYGTEIAFTEYPANSGQYVQEVTGDSHRLRLSGQFDISAAFVTLVQRGPR